MAVVIELSRVKQTFFPLLVVSEHGITQLLSQSIIGQVILRSNIGSFSSAASSFIPLALYKHNNPAASP